MAGYASVELVDKQGDLITRSALKDAFKKFMSDPKYRNVQLAHSNIQVGEVISNYTDNQGRLWKSEVDDAGMFVVGKDILGEFSYNKLIETYTSKYTNNKMADQATIMHLYKDNCSTLNENYNFQRWGSGGDGSNEEFLNKINSLKIIHFSGRRKPWG